MFILALLMRDFPMQKVELFWRLNACTATLKPPLADEYINLKAKLINRASLLPRRLKTVPYRGKIAKPCSSSTSYNLKRRTEQTLHHLVHLAAYQAVVTVTVQVVLLTRKKRQNE
jgi:hypothetical protein